VISTEKDKKLSYMSNNLHKGLQYVMRRSLSPNYCVLSALGYHPIVLNNLFHTNRDLGTGVSYLAY
jgi:hypothetical protein